MATSGNNDSDAAGKGKNTEPPLITTAGTAEEMSPDDRTQDGCISDGGEGSDVLPLDAATAAATSTPTNDSSKSQGHDEDDLPQPQGVGVSRGVNEEEQEAGVDIVPDHTAVSPTTTSPTLPGACWIRGPGWRDDQGSVQESKEEEGEAVFEGFVPEPTRDEILAQEARDMLASAITLEESAIRRIPINSREDGGNRHGRQAQNVNRRVAKNHVSQSFDQEGPPLLIFLKSPVTLIILLVVLLAAIALVVTYRGGGLVEPFCPENLPDRYNHAKSLILDITPREVLEDYASPQSKAFKWIVCEDQISSKMIDDRDPITGILPKQAHGTQYGEDAGEDQVLRRYALATFYFSTSQSDAGPWTETWNFLSPNLHECGWHQIKTRFNFPFGEFDPAGLVCADPRPVGWGEIPEILQDDSLIEIGHMTLNFRIRNNLHGTIPPEFAYISGLGAILIEYQDGLYGPIPSTIANLVNLQSISIQFAGPNFGGEIPSSLFTLPSINYITFYFWEGMLKFPPSLESGKPRNLLGLKIQGNEILGGIPSYISEFANLKELEITGSSLGGTIPESLGDLKFLEYLNFYNNSLTGTLPQSLKNLDSLSTMVFGRNKFYGALPAWVGDLGKLLLLDLSYNEFEGGLPAEFSQMASLEHISLQHNANLNGAISAFEPLQKLSSLLLYGNNFSSTIPENLFANFTRQIVADFGHNKFTGKMPKTFSDNAQNTSYLSIMENDFDADAIDEVICKEVGILNADCNSCPCCYTSCCSDDSIDDKDTFCNFDLDFFRLTKLECGIWWYGCLSSASEAYYDVEPI